MIEGITFLARPPRRGDVVAFRTDNIAGLSRGVRFIKRVAGEPSDQVRISEGKLYVNGQHVPLINAGGEIVYTLPSGSEEMAIMTNVSVPPGKYFVLGDNPVQSLDSRFWGFVPVEDIVGRVSFRYWPYQRAGRVR